jgi:hypothetical protein
MVHTVTDGEGGNNLEIRVASVQKLLVDFIRRLSMHDTCPVYFWIGQVFEDPFSGWLSVFGIQDELEGSVLQDFHGVLAHMSGSAYQLICSLS